MTGHQHEPFDDADLSSDAHASEAKDRSHLHLWIAVGVTMAVILGFWLVLLPSQFGKGGMLSAEANRLKQLEDSGYQATMRASLESIRTKLDAASQTVQQQAPPATTGTPTDPAYKEEIKNLQQKIEQGSTTTTDTTTPKR